MIKRRIDPIQTSLDMRRFFIPKIVAELKKHGVRILKVDVKPSVDWKEVIG